MEKIALNETLSLSRLIYGMWRLGDDNAPHLRMFRQKLKPVLRKG